MSKQLQTNRFYILFIVAENGSQIYSKVKYYPPSILVGVRGSKRERKSKKMVVHRNFFFCFFYRKKSLTTLITY